MKGAIVLLVLLAGTGAVYSQTNQPDPVLKRTLNGLHVQVNAESVTKPNQAQVGNVKVEGIAVQLIKTDHRLQLINPAAPAEYGPAEQNVVRDPVTQRVQGWKFLSLQF